jgi:hypothetical protein
MTLRQQQPVVAGVLNQTAAGLDQSLLQAGQRPVATNPDDVRRAIDILVECGWLRREVINPDGPGRTGERLWVNPKVANMKVDSNGE